MTAIKLHVLKPSVNNLTVRIFTRAAGLEVEEIDAWGNTDSPEFLEKNPSRLTPMIEEEGLPRSTLWESCAIMQYLCNKHGLERFYPSSPEQRAMVDSAMFYLIGTLYPLLARATYPALSFPQYAGEVGSSDADDATKAVAQQAAEAARSSSTGGASSAAIRRRSPTSASQPASSSWRPSTTSCLRGHATSWRTWRPRWALPTPSPPQTCAATSPTCARSERRPAPTVAARPTLR